MTPEQIAKIKALDPDGMNGDIQSIMLGGKLNELPFERALYTILVYSMQSRGALIAENKKLTEVLKDHGLYTSELILGG